MFTRLPSFATFQNIIAQPLVGKHLHVWDGEEGGRQEEGRELHIL